MKILITGASGFLGGFLKISLEKLDHQLICLSSKDCDLTESQALNNLQLDEVDQIYHLANWTQAGDFCLYHPGDQWINNQKINTNVLSYWQEKQPQAKLICIGTSCSYDPNYPLIEENYLSGYPIDSLYTYAMTKRMLLVGLNAINRQYGLNYLYVVPSTLYGPYYHLDGRQMHFIFDLIRKILMGKFFQKQVTLWGDGNQKRELIHVEDFVSKLINLNENITNTVVNLGSGDEYSIREFAKEICDITDYDFNKINFDITKYVGAKSKVLSVEKAKKLLNSYHLKPLNIGLKQTIEWFLENKNILLK
jgi:GDP-L-fucose synthase